MSEQIDWIRADQVPARLNWPEDNYAHHAQLLDGLMGGRIKAKADRGVTVQIQRNNRGQLDVGAEAERDDWDDIPRSLWRDYVYYLHLRGRRYIYDLKPRGSFKEGDWLKVKLTGLWFSEVDLLRELGPVRPGGRQSEEVATQPKRKGSGGSPVDSEKWANFAALLAVYVQRGGDIDPGQKPGSIFSKVKDFGSTLGLNEKDTPNIDTCRRALNQAMAFVAIAKEAEKREAESSDRPSNE